MRAKGQVRRYIRRYGLCFMWTLTYQEAATTWAAVVRDIRRLFKRLQALYGRMPVIAVIERGRRGTRRLHVHLAVGQWLDHAVVRAAWGHGHVWVGDPGKLPPRTGARQLASYLSKYLSKQLEEEAAGESDRPHGAHRYLASHYGTPLIIRRRYLTVDHALADLERLYDLPDQVVAFGCWDYGEVHGLWLSYPDHCMWQAPSP